jgi:hypothetical protein
VALLISTTILPCLTDIVPLDGSQSLESLEDGHGAMADRGSGGKADSAPRLQLETRSIEGVSFLAVAAGFEEHSHWKSWNTERW